jgi:hypothetical protein
LLIRTTSLKNFVVFSSRYLRVVDFSLEIQRVICIDIQRVIVRDCIIKSRRPRSIRNQSGRHLWALVGIASTLQSIFNSPRAFGVSTRHLFISSSLCIRRTNRGFFGLTWAERKRISSNLEYWTLKLCLVASCRSGQKDWK